MSNVGASSSGTAAARKGKGITRGGVTHWCCYQDCKDPEPEHYTGVEVVCEDGKVVKLKGPTEYVWSYGDKYENGFSCYYCGTSIAGGGATRFRQHLAHESGNVVACEKAPPHICRLMADEVLMKQKNKELGLSLQRQIMEANRSYGMHGSTAIPHNEEAQMQMAMRESLREHGLQYGSPPSIGKASGSGEGSCSANHQTTINRFYQSPPSSSKAPFDIDLARSKTQVQPRVDIMLTEGARDKLGLAWAKWFRVNDIPGRKAECPYFISAVKLSQELGKGVHIPRGKEIDGPLLDMNYDDVNAHLADFKEAWNEYGVTIMCDSWTGPTMMSIINFMIFCNGRLFFHKSVDATGCIQNSDFIYDILKEVVVAEVGIKCVVQIITNNGSNYKKACRLLIQEYPHITWQPCAAHTINLMLKDLGKFSFVQYVVDSAKKICRFLYKHNRLHAMMKEKIGGELIRWNATRFGTVYLFLQSFWDRKDHFKLWMASKDWENCAWAGEENHEYTESCLTQKSWWSDTEVVLKAVSPLYTVLRFADQQKNAFISGFLEKMVTANKQVDANLCDSKHKDLHDHWSEVHNIRF